MAFRPAQSRTVRWALGAVAGVAALLGAIFFYVELRYAYRLVPLDEAPAAPVALVFGAGLAHAGEASPMLAARVKTAVALYRSGKVKRVLLTGSSERHHDEIAAMRKLAEASGLPPSALWMDGEGVSTFDSCLRAREVFGVRRVILVTQRFHIARALFIANGLGMDAYGVVTNPTTGRRPAYLLRELFARPLALALVLVQPPQQQPSPGQDKPREPAGVGQGPGGKG